MVIMSRKNDITLFNKNNIRIIRHTELNFSKDFIFPYISRRDIYSSSGGEHESKIKKSNINGKVELKLESPLGFFYTKTVFSSSEDKDTNKPLRKNIRVWDFWGINGNTRITVSYVVKYGDATISTEARPWEIADSTAFEDHLVVDLKKVIDDIIDQCKSCKKAYKTNEGKFEDKVRSEDRFGMGDHNEVKRLIYKDIFGYPEGPKFQTNEEKILSHGFDPKTSFRK